ncbi:MAG TPA: tetratricopeptide repeat protein [Candidatus Bathyarchaeia archaeon]|nr:tetratricopeptide repeat protein [Candidatus Bathyarchaeia archaeon]
MDRKGLEGIDILKREFGIDFRLIAPDTCFLASSVTTARRHKAAPHVYTSEKLSDRRVGWVYRDACTLALSGKYLDSLARFDEVIRLEPAYVHAWNQKGLCDYFLGRYASAIECFDKCSALDGRYAESHNNKGCTLQRLDEFDAAIECFDAAEAIQLGLFEVSNNKAISLIALGDFTAALTCIDRCLASHGTNWSVCVLRSLCFLALGETEQGFWALRFAERLAPTNRHVLTLLDAISRAAIA